MKSHRPDRWSSAAVSVVAVTVVVLTIAGSLAPRPLTAQEPSDAPPGRVILLEEEEVTAERLIEILTPPDDGAGARGLSPRGGARGLGGPVSCARFREGGAAARGLTARPVADIAAVPILFEFDSAALMDTERRKLDEMGRALGDATLSSCCFRIEGHTDSIGTEEYNLGLSERRAKSVVRYLEDRFGVERDRLLIVGLGEGDPVADNATDDGRAQNRRVQLVNLGFGEVEQ